MVAYASIAGDRVTPLVAGLGVGGCVIAVVAIALRMPVAIAWGVALVGASYAVFLRLRAGDVDGHAIYVAAALVVACELAFSSLRRAPGVPDRGLRIEAAAKLVVVTLATLVAGDVVLVASGSARSNVFVEAMGVVAAVLCVGFVVRSAARSRDSTST